MIDALKFKMMRISESKGMIALAIICAFCGIVFFVTSGDAFVILITTPLAAVIGPNRLTLDEKCHLNYYEDAMPFSRKNMVNAEYLAAVIAIVTSIILILVFVACLIMICGWRPNPEIMEYDLKSNLDLIFVVVFLNSGTALIPVSLILMGIYYDLSTVFVAMCLIVLLGGISVALSTLGDRSFDLIVFAIGVVIFAVSWHKSIGRNEKRNI